MSRMFVELSNIALACASCAGTMIHVSSSFSAGNALKVSTLRPCTHAAINACVTFNTRPERQTVYELQMEDR